jgi:tRNA dimethylallyltransferase
MKVERPPLVVIAGPTGAGKSELSLEAAARAGVEIVSADSQQVYRGMDIGTGKLMPAERRGIRHHLIDVVDPDEEMTAARFAALADRAIQEGGAPVVVVGGTMLYLRALLFGLFEGPAADAELRAELAERARREGSAALWSELRAVDADSAARIHATDERRITRALEVFRLTGKPLSQHHREHNQATREPRYPVHLLVLAPSREELYRRIDARVDAMMQAGLLEEVKGLRARGYGPGLRSQQAIGYAELHQHLEGRIDLAETVRLIKRNSRRYGRRQRSWYRNERPGLVAQWAESSAAVDLEVLRRYLSAPKPSR